jgi:hypothetical protein
MKKIQKLEAGVIAEILHNVAFDFYTRANHGLLDNGPHRHTLVTVIRELMDKLDQQASWDDQEFDRLAFLDKSGYFEIANHASMEGYPYCTKREDYIYND